MNYERRRQYIKGSGERLDHNQRVPLCSLIIVSILYLTQLSPRSRHRVLGVTLSLKGFR